MLFLGFYTNLLFFLFRTSHVIYIFRFGVLSHQGLFKTVRYYNLNTPLKFKGNSEIKFCC